MTYKFEICANSVASRLAAPQGASLLRALHDEARSVILMAGCGVNESNIAPLASATGIQEFHFSAREPFASQMRYRNQNIYMGAPDADENTLMVTTARRVSNTIKMIKL